MNYLQPKSFILTYVCFCSEHTLSFDKLRTGRVFGLFKVALGGDAFALVSIFSPTASSPRTFIKLEHGLFF